MLFLWLLIFVHSSFGLKVLMISTGAAGHVIPMFELARAMKNHHVTFLTEPYAQSFIDFQSYSNLSSFHIIYTNDSSDALIDQKKLEKDLAEHFINHSLVDSLSYLLPAFARSVDDLMNRTIHLLMIERFDVIIAESFVKGIDMLSKEANTPCVISRAGVKLDTFDMNMPNSNSFLSPRQLSEFKYRIYNVAFNLRLIISIGIKLIELRSVIFRTLPQIPGPFYETMSLKNWFFTKTQCLTLCSIPPTLFSLSDSDHYTKYLGAFIDESHIEYVDNDLTRWIKMKPDNSIIYVAFGSIARIRSDRMTSLVNGLAEFLLQTSAASVLFAFRNINYDTYQTLLNEMEHNEYQRILLDHQRVRVEKQFVPQKWILQQNSVHLFISHCGMGSVAEGLHFQKPILCLPLSVDQFVNSMAIAHSGVEESLFIPPSMFQSLIRPNIFHYYTFSANSVTIKLSYMWKNSSFQNGVRMMSAEMKYAGGVKRAVEEIEFFVSLNGNLDRYAPFSSTLPFYQRYMLDLMIIYIVLPIIVILYLPIKYCRRNQKKKID